MRDIRYLVVHTTATSQKATIKAIQDYWKHILGWNSPGYHFIYTPSGKEVQLQNIDQPTNGVKGYNQHSIHLSFIGGIEGKIPADNRTVGQKRAMLHRLRALKAQFPKARILGHRDFPGVKKACPCFDAIKEYQYL